MFVFLIEANPLISVWLKHQVEACGDKFYHLASLKDAAYFIQDLNPDVLVIDGQTAQKDAGEFVMGLKEFPHIKNIPTIGLGLGLPEWAGLLNIKGQLSKPLNPEKFHAEVRELLK
jgi:CheY-like chemotaxis protein